MFFDVLVAHWTEKILVADVLEVHLRRVEKA